MASPIDDWLEETKKRQQGAASSSSQSGGQAYADSKPVATPKPSSSPIDAWVATTKNRPASQPVQQTQPTQPAEKKSLFSSVGGVLKETGTKVLELGGKGLRAGLDLWNAPTAKNEVTDFKMRQILDRNNTLEVDPVTGKKSLTNDVMKAYNAAQTPEERQAIIDADTHEIPLIKAMNSPTGRKVLSFIGDNISNVPLKAIAGVQSGKVLQYVPIVGALARLKGIGDDTYDEAYAALLADRNNPENGAFKQFLYELQDSVVQSAIGVLLSLGATYASRSPAAGRIVGMSYYTGISGNAQQQERGEVNSLGNIAIDVVGDMVLGTALESVFKGGSGVIRTALKSAGIEGTTEVGQSFLKYGNDYANARTQAEKDAVLAEAKKYVVDGGMLMEFAVGGVAGGIIGGVAEAVAPSMTFETKGAAPVETEKKESPVAEDNTPNFYSNTRDLLGEYETALSNGETVANDEEFSNVAELRNQLSEYQTLNKDKTLFLPEQAAIEVVQYEDGNFAMRFTAKAGNISITAPFSNTQLFSSKEEATEAGRKEIDEWVKTQMAKTKDRYVIQALSQLQQDLTSSVEAGEQDFSEVLSAIETERMQESGEYDTVLSGRQSELDTAIREELVSGTATVEQLIERFSTGAIKFTEEEIRARVLEVQNPEGSVRALELQLIEMYADAGFNEDGRLVAEEMLYQIALQMELSEAGYRVFVPAEVGGGSDVRGVSSTFPKWIPEKLRSSDLFSKVLSGLEISTLRFPTGNRSRQRELYNIILGELDAQLGVDTSAVREQIISLYENNNTQNNLEGQAAKSDGSSTSRGERPAEQRVAAGGETTRTEKIDPLAEEAIKVVEAPAPEPKTSTPSSRASAAQKPVESSGKSRPSRAFERVRERLNIEESESYNRLNLAEDAARAQLFVEQNEAIAKRIALGLETPPEGYTDTAISIAYAEKMSQEGKLQEQADAERARSLRQTRRGQEIVAERGRIGENSPEHFVRNVLKARLDEAGKKARKFVESRGKTNKQVAVEEIDRQTKDLKKRITSRRLKLQDAQALLNGLTC